MSSNRKAATPTLTTCPTMRLTSAAATTSSSAFTCSRRVCALTTPPAWFPLTAWPWDPGSRRSPASNLPGVSSTDLATANSLLATLGGYVDGYSQTFNVTSRSSGFVANSPFIRHFLDNSYSFYAQDKWKLLPNLTVTLGLRYQLPGVVDEADSLELSPVLQGTAEQTLLSNATLNFAGSSAGRPWYRREWKDFAPNFGFAWDVFGDGKTAVRGGYSLSYVNDQEILAPEDLARDQRRAARRCCRHRPVQSRLDRPAADRSSHLPGAPDGRRQLRQQPVQCGRHDRSQPEASLRAAIFHRHPAPGEGHALRSALRGQPRGWRLPRVRLQPGGDQPERLPAGLPARPEQRLAGAGQERRFQSQLQCRTSPAARR
jgi:hypothetical protein